MTDMPIHPAYAYPQGYPYAPMARAGNGLAVAGLVLGIVGLVFGIAPFGFVLGFPCGVLGVIFGCLGRNAVRTQGRSGKGQATAGIVTGALGVLFSILWFAVIAVAANNVATEFDQVNERLYGDSTYSELSETTRSDYADCMADPSTSYDECQALLYSE